MAEELEIENRVGSLVIKLFDLPLESATAALRLGDPPQWDSMGHMELLVAVENEFGVRFPAHQIATLTSVRRIADAVRANERI